MHKHSHKRDAAVWSAGFAFLALTLFPYFPAALMAVCGLLCLLYGTVLSFLIPLPHQRPALTKVCLRSNHAGCLDHPDCSCRCHGERISQSLPLH